MERGGGEREHRKTLWQGKQQCQDKHRLAVPDRSRVGLLSRPLLSVSVPFLVLVPFALMK